MTISPPIIDIVSEDISDLSKKISINPSKYKVDFAKEVPPIKIAWEIKDSTSEEFYLLGSLGNFSLIKGKAKSKKSFFINMAICSALKNGIFLNRFRSPLDDKHNQVLYIDTEQSDFHVQRAAKSICSQLNVEIPENISMYRFRSLSPKERLKCTEDLIMDTSNLGFVVIDGIRDLITSINEEAESTEMASKLLKWSEEKEIHIVTVLHENPSSEKARGHIGTELTNKAETVLKVEVDNKEPRISIVSPSYCRNKEFEPFAFEINEHGLPQLIEEFNFNERKTKSRFDVTKLGDRDKVSIFYEVFEKGDEFNYGALQTQIKILLDDKYKGKNGKGEGKIKQLITYAQNEGWITQDGPRKPYKLGKI